jgi:hypothetical protein
MCLRLRHRSLTFPGKGFPKQVARASPLVCHEEPS